MAEENWDNELEYLQKSRFLSHNDDYLEFLVKKVWRLNKPAKLVDFGCGFGYLGTKLMPLLPERSSYTGVDKAPTLLEAGRDIFAKLNYSYRFVETEVYKTPFPDASFDLTVSHAVLMHLERPAEALREMVRVTRPGGLVVAANANRNAWYAIFHLEEFNTQETVSLTFAQQLNQDIRLKTGVDYNIGIKTPVLMEKAGLKNIGCRMSDSVTLLFPSMEEEKKKRIFEFFCMEGLALPEDFQKTRGKTRERLLSYGVRPEDVEKQLENEEKMDFRHQGMAYHNVVPNLLTRSYGTVEK